MSSSSQQIPFWEQPLNQLNTEEWEALCDHCGRCCLKKLADEDSEDIYYTSVICRYFDQSNNQCQQYHARKKLVPDCLVVSEEDIADLHWMPDTCAYRLRFEDKPLFDWHPLIAGSRAKMDAAGISVKGKVLSEEYVHPDGLAEHVIKWVNAGSYRHE